MDIYFNTYFYQIFAQILSALAIGHCYNLAVSLWHITIIMGLLLSSSSSSSFSSSSSAFP